MTILDTLRDDHWMVAVHNDYTVDGERFTFWLLTTKGNPFYRTYYADVVAAEKTGERTVKFTFKDGINRELPLIIGQMVVLPKHGFETRAFDKTTLEPPLGSGPYRVESLDAGRAITYVRVDDYWAKDLPVRKGQYNFDRYKNSHAPHPITRARNRTILKSCFLVARLRPL